MELEYFYFFIIRAERVLFRQYPLRIFTTVMKKIKQDKELLQQIWMASRKSVISSKKVYKRQNKHRERL